MARYKSFETERLILKPTSLEDAEFIFELLNTPKWLQYIGDRKVKTVNDAKEYIEKKVLPQMERLGYGNYTLIRKSDKVKIGTCGLYDREGLEGVDIGFAFLPQYEKMGYAFEAASRVKQAALEEFKIPGIKAITVKENSSSQKLLEKLGLKFVKMVRIPNDEVELMLYELAFSK